MFGFAAGIGYRMYHHDGKLHRFRGRRASCSWATRATARAFGIAVGVELGLEREIADWLALSGAIGGQVLATNSFNDLQVAPTADLSATFYFK